MTHETPLTEAPCWFWGLVVFIVLPNLMLTAYLAGRRAGIRLQQKWNQEHYQDTREMVADWCRCGVLREELAAFLKRHGSKL